MKYGVLTVKHVAGFVWWQGHKDQNSAHASRYEQNLVHLIKTLRNKFNAPKAHLRAFHHRLRWMGSGRPGLTVANAQLAVSGDKGKYGGWFGWGEGSVVSRAVLAI